MVKMDERVQVVLLKNTVPVCDRPIRELQPILDVIPKIRWSVPL